MNKEEFISELNKKLSGLPKEDIDDRISFYSEMIDDRVEEGLTEEEAVAKIGAVDDVVKQVMSEIPLKKLVREKVRPKKKMGAGGIALLILCFPIWFPLLITAAALIFSFFVTLWSIVISFYAVDISLAVVSLSGIISSIYFLAIGKPIAALFFVGICLILAGLTIFMFIACVYITKGVIQLTGCIINGVKRLFIGKEA